MSALDRRLIPPLYGDPERWALIHADALSFLAAIPDNSVDAVVTDPPYGIAFKGEKWDGELLADPDGFTAFTTTWAREIHRVLKPGGYLASFGATRTFHRLVTGVEDAGLEIRDQLLWLQSTGVPKSRRLPGERAYGLKPSYEPILLARKPPRRGTGLDGSLALSSTGAVRPQLEQRAAGRERFWTANVGLTHDDRCAPEGCVSDCPARVIDTVATAKQTPNAKPVSRLFYAVKASQAEREAGLQHLPAATSEIFSTGGAGTAKANVHPTVKPLALMRWVIRLVTPDGGVVLDPFAGSGSTGCAALLEDRPFVGIERDSRYVPIAAARMRHWATIDPSEAPS